MEEKKTIEKLMNGKKNPNKNETKVVILVDRKGPGSEVLTQMT